MRKATRGRSAAVVGMVLCIAVVAAFFVASRGRPWLVVGRGLLPPAAGVLASFEFDGDVRDTSGQGRHGVLLGGEFVPGLSGQSLKVGSRPSGVDWSAFASLLNHPFTVEVVLTPSATTSYAKIFGPNAAADPGWYYVQDGLCVYPSSTLGTGSARAGELHYIAFVSAPGGQVDVFFQGAYLGRAAMQWRSPPSEAIFFQDDNQTGGGEQLAAVVHALRISSVARTPEEIAAAHRRLVKR